MIRYIREKITFPAADGKAALNGELMLHPEKEPDGCAIVCHPHPGFGGSMHNYVVAELGRLLCDAGFVSLRFDFRSVGMASEECGSAGEVEDIRGAVEFAKSKGYEKFILVGYSFGSHMAFRACAGGLVPDRLILVALPSEPPFVNPEEFAAVYLTMPTLMVSGDNDEYSNMETLKKRFGSAPNISCKTVPDCDHFFSSQESFGEMIACVKVFLSGSGQ
ncbi:MAG: alpha/beta fold hydrolase [Planctomycetota bacterium]|nr:MAG: alpha/beta fold hydrolase [Planctomycetota bacterium]